MFGSVGLPHGFCFLWDPGLLWLHVVSDSLIALAYFLIPLALVRIVLKRKDIPFNGVFFCFAAFIVACGVTHVMEVVTLWHPIYWVSGVLKAVTAAISVATLVVLVRISPALLMVPHELADRRFRELIEDAPDAIVQIDQTGRIVLANRTAEQMFGYTREQLLGSTIHTLIPERNRTVHPTDLGRFALPGGASLLKGLGDLHALRKDGSEFSVEIALSPIDTALGIHVTAMIRDVSDRKRAERELDHANHQLESMLESTIMCVLAVESNWSIDYMNRSARQLLKLDGELHGMTIWDVFPAMHAESRERLQHVMDSREPAVFEDYYEPLDLSTRMKAAPWNHGGITIFFSDISEQKRVAQELQRTSAQLTSLLESTSTCVLATDGSWKIEYMNGNAKALLNVHGDVLGQELWAAFPATDTVTQEGLRKAMETREPVSFENYYEPFDLSARVQAHPWGGSGLTIYFNDVSKEKRLQRELEEERARRNQRIEVLARLSSGLAHEIKNPLAIIHARASDLAEMAEEGDVETADIVRSCSSIVRTSDRAIRILRGVAAMARVGTHDPMESIDVKAMVDQAVELVNGRYMVSGIQLETAVPQGLPRLQCREVQISQILVNLLNNAFDAVDGHAESERWVRVQVLTQAPEEHENHIGRLEIDVVDGGPGVAAEHKARLMETFFTTKAVGAGIGIGLSVSRAIAEDHGGQLELRECDGHTCFRLTLPLEATPAQGVAA